MKAAPARETLSGFSGVEHRLEFVLEAGGARYYNDSIATIPEAALAALNTFPPKTVIQIVREGVQPIVELLAKYDTVCEKMGDPDADMDAALDAATFGALQPGCSLGLVPKADTEKRPGRLRMKPGINW